ncbi:unnamed protein product [Oikopleura dioica]|uniref:Ig-like domain-containing protein n=2 Tax=Oikopleura dioica TaxID=34765 RepID=E4XWQ6_OIKDI|nr:unnamed protein product [Oikopleura dioica]
MKIAALLVGAGNAVPLKVGRTMSVSELEPLSLLKSGEVFKLESHFRVPEGIDTQCGKWPLVIDVSLDEKRIMQGLVDKGFYKFRAFDTMPKSLSGDITISNCSGKAAENDEKCPLPTDGSVEDFDYSVELAGLTIEDSGKTVGLAWNCDSELLNIESTVEIWQQGEIAQSVNTTDLSSDMNATIVASCSVSGELPKVEQITFNIGQFGQDVIVDENGLAQLNVSGSELLGFGGANIHAQAIECSATQIATNGVSLATYDISSAETVQFSYPTSYAQIRVANAIEFDSKSYLAKGSAVSVTCEADGFPAPVKTVTANGNALDESIVLTEKTVLKCVADEKQDIKIVDIFYLEDVVINHDGHGNAEDLIYENSDVKFSCDAKSNPMASFSLLKDGEIISDHGEKEHNIKVVSGMYTCAASLDAVFRLDIVESAGTMITAEPAPQEGSGNTIMIVVIVIICLCLIGAVGFVVWKKRQTDKGEEVPQDEADAEDEMATE